MPFQDGFPWKFYQCVRTLVVVKYDHVYSRMKTRAAGFTSGSLFGGNLSTRAETVPYSPPVLPVLALRRSLP
jgi:hypothetical protein